MSGGRISAAELERIEAALSRSGGDFAMATAVLAGDEVTTDQTALGDRLAAVRWIDAPLYDALFATLPGAPGFAALIQNRPWYLPDVPVAQGDGRYGWASDAAFGRDVVWQERDKAGHQAWHETLAHHFGACGGAELSLDMLYHATRANGDDVLALFETAFGLADDRFDVPRLNALLQTLRRPAPPPQSPLGLALGQAESYFAGRSLFRRDYQLTTRFFERASAFASFESVFNQPERWIWHMHATGGVGKTTFLRWLIARHLLPRPGRAICARIDFDDYRLDTLVTYPLLAMAELLRQIDRQDPSNQLLPVLQALNDAAREPGWNDRALEIAAGRLASVRIDRPVVVILDTLEEATRSQAAWLERLIEQLATLRVAIPRLMLILSGRYDASELVPASLGEAMIVHELSGFDEDEALDYLARIEGIGARDVQQAMLDRVQAGDPGEAGEERRFNPFKLHLLSEIVRGDPQIDVRKIRAIESVDLAYLIERVVLRIENQRVRWLIRYAVVARELDQAFLEDVLLPEMRASLDGTSTSDAVSADRLGGGHRGEIVWQPEPEASRLLTAEALLDELRRYASDRGWISVESGGAVIRLHPDVVEPTRRILRKHKVYQRLHKNALRHANKLRRKAATPEDWVKARSMALFHSYQLEPEELASDWREALDEAAEHGAAAVEAIAAEIDGKDYDGCPKAMRAEAHLRIAQVLIEQAIDRGEEDFALQAGIVHHIDLAVHRHASSVDALYREIPARLGTGPDLTTELPPPGSTGTRARLYFDLAMAWRLSLLSAPDRRRASLEHLDNARKNRARWKLRLIGDMNLALRQSDIARGLSDPEAAKAALRSVPRTQRDDLDLEFSVWLAQAANSLLEHDVADAEARLSASRALSRLARPNGSDAGRESLLRMDCALARHDMFAALKEAERDHGPPWRTADIVGILCRGGYAAALAFEFDRAEDFFRKAEALVERSDNAAVGGLAWENLRWRVTATLRGMRNPNLAERLLHAGTNAGSGRLRADHEAEIDGFRIWISLLRGDEQQAGDALPSPKALADAPPGTAWAIALATLGLADATRTPQLLDILEGPLPAAGVFYPAVDMLADRQSTIPADLLHTKALVGRLPSIGWLAPTSALDRVRQADVLRVLGRNGRAGDKLGGLWDASTKPATMLLAIERERAKARLGLQTDFAELQKQSELKAFTPSRHRALKAVVGVLRGQELAALGAWEPAKKHALHARHHFWEQRDASGWSQRIWEIAALADRHLGAATLRESDHVFSVQAEVGLAPMPGLSSDERQDSRDPTSGWTRRELRLDTLLTGPNRLPFDLNHRATSEWVALWLHDPEGARDWMGEAALFAPVRRGARVDLDIERQLADEPAGALPWELARVFDKARLVRRSTRSSQRQNPFVGKPVTTGSVLIGRFAKNDLERGAVPSSFYRRSTAIGRISVVNPTKDDLFASVTQEKTGPVAVIHITAAMLEAKRGYALDFRDTNEFTSSTSYGLHGQLELSVRDLQSILASYQSRPLVILDIATTDNEAAAMEMLVQRNAFAAAVYDPARMRGLIATGLVSSRWDEWFHRVLLDALGDGGTVGEIFAGIRATPGTGSGELLWSRASALWCEDIDAPVWKRDGSA